MSPERRVFDCLGGECELFAVGASSGARLDEAMAWTRAQHARLTRFDPASELSRLNAAAGRWVDVSADLHALLAFALEAHERSGGLVHAGVLPALLAAGYTRTFEEGPTLATPEPPAPLPPLRELLALRVGQARLADGAALDLGGLAKGWLADRLCERLGENALANLGGDLYARGAGPGGEGWPVGFGGSTLLLRDLGAATSGVTRRHWGDGLHHLIDPRTALPAVLGVREVSVLAASGAEAEVLAKTALLLGREAGADHLRGRAQGWWFE